MTIDRFKDELTDRVLRLAEPGEEITLRTITKNNCTKRVIISVKVPDGITVPSFYITDLKYLYDNGLSIDTIAKEVIERGRAHSISHVPEDVLSDDYAHFKDRIVLRLVNHDENMEFLEDHPHRHIEDLAIVYYYYSKEGDIRLGNIVVSDDDMKRWGVTEEDLFRDAYRNTPVLKPLVIRPLTDFINEAFSINELWPDVDTGFPPGPWEIKDLSLIGEAVRRELPVPLIVLTNSDMHCGAAVILYDGLLQSISDEIGSDLYVIPSSIHEMLILPCADYVISAEELDIMISEINDSTVKEDEVLANHVYFYDREEGRLEMA